MPKSTAENGKAYREKVSRELTTMKQQPRYPGRPIRYTPELGHLVCQRMLESGGLLEACRDNAELPERVTVYGWAVNHLDFGVELSRAKEMMMELWVDDIKQIADDDRLDPNDRRVKIDARKWIASKLAARRYGDKIQVSGDPENPLILLHRTVELEQLSAAELDALGVFTAARCAAIDAEHETIEDTSC